MKKFIFGALCALAMTIGFSSCTENQRARTFGGTTVIEVERGQKVMMATWKDEDLFYMTEEMDSTYVPHNKTLVESSSFGLIESKVIFKESR